MLSKLSGVRVLVTGHTGFKGSWLVHVLNHLGAEVAGYALEPMEGSHFLICETETSLIRHSIGDVRDQQSLSKAIQEFKPNIVIHMAAQALVSEGYRKPFETFTTNILGTLNVLEVSSQFDVERLLVVTTDKVYKDGKDSKARTENDSLGGWDPYSSSKAAADIVAQGWWSTKRQKTKIAIARGGNVLGGGDISTDRLIPDIERSLDVGADLTVRNPLQVRPWQHVLDCLAGYLAVITADDEMFEDTWNIGPELGQGEINVENLIRDYLSVRGRDLACVVTPSEMHETGHLTLDPSKTQRILGWSSKLSSLETIRQTALWNRHVVDERQEPKAETLSQIQEYFNRFS